MTEAARDQLAQVRLTAAAVIPAYREEKHIGDIVRRTRLQLDHVLVVDDGSDDQTARRARDAGAEVIVHNENCGKGEAIKTGLRHWLDRQFIRVLILDADGQHLPEEIAQFIAAAAIAADPSFFLGNRMTNVAGMPLLRRVVNRYMSKQISSLCGQTIPDTQWLSHVGSAIDSGAPWRVEPFRLRNRNAHHCLPQRISYRISPDHNCLLG